MSKVTLWKDKAEQKPSKNNGLLAAAAQLPHTASVSATQFGEKSIKSDAPQRLASHDFANSYQNALSLFQATDNSQDSTKNPSKNNNLLSSAASQTLSFKGASPRKSHQIEAYLGKPQHVPGPETATDSASIAAAAA